MNNDLILLDAILNKRVEDKNPSEKNDEVFEFFVYEQVLKEYDLSKEEIFSGSVDGENDGGIDAIYIFVNNVLFNDKIDIESLKNANLEIIFFTCKHYKSFRQAPINDSIVTLDEFVDLSKKNEELISRYNKRLLNKRSLIDHIIKTLLINKALSKFNIRFIYACRGDDEIEICENIKTQGERIKDLFCKSFSSCTCDFEFWGSNKLLETYRKAIDYTITIEAKEEMSHSKQYVVLTTLQNYYKSIIFPDGKLKKYLFDSNIRDFMGLNAVNNDILNSLYDSDGEQDFWWLNNGITILCSAVNGVGKSYTITNARIINGLQTSECIYRYMSNVKENDNRLVLIKIISCENPKICDNIIKSTNNQTAIYTASLWATDKIQTDIEEILLKNGWYYERRVNYYLNMGISTKKIVSPLYLASGCIALVLKRPEKASSLKQRHLRKNENYKLVFNEKIDIRVWHSILKCLKIVDGYLEYIKSLDASIYKNTEKFLKKCRYIVAFLLVVKITKKFNFSVENLIEINFDDIDRNEIKQVWSFLEGILLDIKNKNFNLSKTRNIGIFKIFSEKFLISDFCYINAKYNEPEVLLIKIDKINKAKNKRIKTIGQNNKNSDNEFVKHSVKFSSKIDNNKLTEIAENALNKLYDNRKIVELDNMSSSERYFIHKYFESKSNVKCYSIGENENRHIILEYIK